MNKIKVLVGALNAALSAVKPVVVMKSYVAQWKSVVFSSSSKDGTVSLSATDSDSFITIPILDAKADSSFSFPVEYKNIQNVLKGLSKKSFVELELISPESEESIPSVLVRMESGSSVKIPVSGEMSDFPVHPSIPADAVWTELPRNFLKCLSECFPFVSENDPRVYLKGVFCDSTHGGRLAATDGHVLCVRDCRVPELTELKSFILCNTACEILLKQKPKNDDSSVLKMTWRNDSSSKDDDDENKEHHSKGILFFRSVGGNDSLNIASRKVDATYPDIDVVVPKKYSWSINADRNELLRSATEASKLSNAENRFAVALSMSSDGNHLIFADPKDKEWTLAPIAATTESHSKECLFPDSLGFDAGYLKTVFSSLPEGMLSIKGNENTGPILVHHNKPSYYGDCSDATIIMPLDLSSWSY